MNTKTILKNMVVASNYLDLNKQYKSADLITNTINNIYKSTGLKTASTIGSNNIIVEFQKLPDDLQKFILSDRISNMRLAANSDTLEGPVSILYKNLLEQLRNGIPLAALRPTINEAIDNNRITQTEVASLAEEAANRSKVNVTDMGGQSPISPGMKSNIKTVGVLGGAAAAGGAAVEGLNQGKQYDPNSSPDANADSPGVTPSVSTPGQLQTIGTPIARYDNDPDYQGKNGNSQSYIGYGYDALQRTNNYNNAYSAMVNYMTQRGETPQFIQAVSDEFKNHFANEAAVTGEPNGNSANNSSSIGGQGTSTPNSDGSGSNLPLPGDPGYTSSDYLSGQPTWMLPPSNVQAPQYTDPNANRPYNR